MTLATFRHLTTPRALALAGSLLLAGCSPHATITVTNASREPLTELRVVGEADSTRVADLAPGARAVVHARIHGEDAIVLRGRIGGRPLRPSMAAYVESGIAQGFVVDSTGFVRAETGRVATY